MVNKPFERRSLLRGAGALTAASLAPWAAGCAADDDDALTFFFAANPDELRPRMRVVNEFQRRYPDIKVRALLSGPGVMQQLATFCAGGKCPDVLMAWELTYAELADRGVLLDLNTLLARDQAFAAELKSDSIGATHAARRGDDRQRGSLVLRRAGSLWNRRACRRRAAPAPLG